MFFYVLCRFPLVFIGRDLFGILATSLSDSSKYLDVAHDFKRRHLFNIIITALRNQGTLCG